MTNHRIYISGASGAGVSTLGMALADRLQLAHFDVDGYYWHPTDPPFQQARLVRERIEPLERDLPEYGWVVSGSMDGWGNRVIERAARKGGRSRPRHEAWLSTLRPPAVRLNGEWPVEALIEEALRPLAPFMER